MGLWEKNVYFNFAVRYCKLNRTFFISGEWKKYSRHFFDRDRFIKNLLSFETSSIFAFIISIFYLRKNYRNSFDGKNVFFSLNLFFPWKIWVLAKKSFLGVRVSARVGLRTTSSGGKCFNSFGTSSIFSFRISIFYFFRPH